MILVAAPANGSFATLHKYAYNSQLTEKPSLILLLAVFFLNVLGAQLVESINKHTPLQAAITGPPSFNSTSSSKKDRHAVTDRNVQICSG